MDSLAESDRSFSDAFSLKLVVCRPDYVHYLLLFLEINECLSNPCEENMKCVDGINTFTCVTLSSGTEMQLKGKMTTLIYHQLIN